MLSRLGRLSALARGAAGARPMSALSGDEFRAFEVIGSRPASHDSQIVTLALPGGATSGLTACGLVMARLPGSEEARPYTPTSPVAAAGRLELLVKGYPGGAVSEPLTRVAVGDRVELSGPFPKFQYAGPGSLRHVGLVAGGSGLTPMWQLLTHILSNPADAATKVTLVFANKSEADILKRDALDALATVCADRFDVHYLVDDGEGLDLRVGRVDAAVLAETMPAPGSEGAMVFVCGPPPMLEGLAGPKGENFTQGPLEGVLKEMGYTEGEVFKF